VEQFSDLYAQTLCYGLFTARCHAKPGAHFTRQHVAYDLPRTHPFLRTLFNHIAGPELNEDIAWAVDDAAELLARADIAAILRDFGQRTRREDPVVHFYETLLAAYDPALRETRGVYYTPEPVGVVSGAQRGCLAQTGVSVADGPGRRRQDHHSGG